MAAAHHHAYVMAWMCVMFFCGGIMILLGLYHIRILPTGGKKVEGGKTLKESLHELWAVFVGVLREEAHRLLYHASSSSTASPKDSS
jgi:PAT family beta-lactamase induction signal transducer AmpG